MPPRLLVLSREAAEAYEPQRREVCISIGDTNHLPVPLSPKFLSVLRLNFSDLTEEGPLPFDLLFAPEHAIRIIEFISRWRDVDQIVIHCRAGISRSPGVALGICELQGLPVRELEREKPWFNTWVRDELVRIGCEVGWPIARANSNRNDPLDALRDPARLWARCEVLQRSCPVPAAPGVYAWFFREVPPGVPVNGAIGQHGLTLLHVGIAPALKGSSSTLRSRIRQHYRGNALGSSLRFTLGCLLAEDLGIGFGEDRLSEWMAANAFVCWVEHPRAWEIAEEMISDLRPPLNSEANSLRKEMKRRAKRSSQ